MKQFSLKVLGCKVNAYEAESIASLLEVKGYQRTVEKEADITIIWTKASLNFTSVLFQKEEIFPKIVYIRFRKNLFFQCLCVL